MTLHTLSQRDMEEIFHHDIAPLLLDREGRPSDNPVAHVVGGQPGAGKTTTVDAIKLGHTTPLVAVVGDELRQFHPDYDELMATDPRNMPAHTAEAAGNWVQMSLRHAADNRYDTIWETTFRSPDALQRDVDQFRAHGYNMNITAIACPREVSLMSTVQRYLQQYDTEGAGRILSPQQHDEAYQRAGYSLDQLADGNTQITVVTREHEIIYRGTDAAEAKAGLQLGRTLRDDQRRDLDAQIAPVREHLTSHAATNTASAQALQNLQVVENHTTRQPDAPVAQHEQTASRSTT